MSIANNILNSIERAKIDIDLAWRLVPLHSTKRVERGAKTIFTYADGSKIIAANDGIKECYVNGAL